MYSCTLIDLYNNSPTTKIKLSGLWPLHTCDIWRYMISRIVQDLTPYRYHKLSDQCFDTQTHNLSTDPRCCRCCLWISALSVLPGMDGPLQVKVRFVEDQPLSQCMRSEPKNGRTCVVIMITAGQLQGTSIWFGTFNPYEKQYLTNKPFMTTGENKHT